jgi:hypothetical protein
VTGTWRGKIIPNNAGGEMSAYMALTQSDGTITGTAGGNANSAVRIRDGKIESDRLTIEASPREGVVLRFALKINGDVLEGDVEENGQNIGTVTLKRQR